MFFFFFVLFGDGGGGGSGLLLVEGEELSIMLCLSDLLSSPDIGVSRLMNNVVWTGSYK